MSINKKNGMAFEKEFCQLASNIGFWVHRLIENVNGQPADLILCKKNIPVLIDCKVCESNKFLFSRIEENQELAMTKWLELGNKHALFALKIENEIILIPFTTLRELKQAGYKQLNKDQIKEFGQVFSFLEELIDVD